MNEQAARSELTVTPVVPSPDLGEGTDQLVRLLVAEARELAAVGEVDPAIIDAVLVGSAGFAHGPFSLDHLESLAVAPEARRSAPLEVVDHGADELRELLRTSDVPVLESNQRHGVIELPHGGVLVSTSGATAVELGLEWGPQVIVVDRMLAGTTAVAMTAHPGCDTRALDSAVGLVQAASIAVHFVPDLPGLVTARILATLRNAAADLVGRTTLHEDDLDAGFRAATEHSTGLAAWARACGPGTVVDILAALQLWYGAERYRPSPVLRRANLLTMTPGAPGW